MDSSVGPKVDVPCRVRYRVSTPRATGGFLSRHANPELRPLIDAAASEPVPTNRAARYRELGVLMKEQPAAICPWDLTALYGV